MWLFTGLSIPHKLLKDDVYHRPLIATESVCFDKIGFLHKAQKACGLIISSQETVKYLADLWPELENVKAIFVTGESSYKAVASVYKGSVYRGSSEDQEGLLQAIVEHNAHRLLYPRAQEVRGFLKRKLNLLQIDCEEIICYKTQVVSQTQDLPETLSGYIFSSPSTVKAFKHHFGLPKYLPLKVKGHVTKKAVLDIFGEAYAPVIDFY